MVREVAVLSWSTMPIDCYPFASEDGGHEEEGEQRKYDASTEVKAS